MELAEFNPLPIEAEVDGQLFELRPFDLQAMVWAESYFSDAQIGGLNILKQRLENPEVWQEYAEAVVDTVFYLLADEDEIPSLCVFKGLINKSEDGPARSIAKLYFSLSQNLVNSFPVEETPEPAPDGKEPVEHKGEKPEPPPPPNDWAEIYTIVAGHVGCTIKEFYRYTYRQINAILTEIHELKLHEIRLKTVIENRRIQVPQTIKKPARDFNPWQPDEEDFFRSENEKLIKSLQEKANTVDGG